MAGEFNSPGVRIREKRSGVPQIRGVPTSVGGMIGQTLRGPVGVPIRLSSFAMLTRMYGSYNPNSLSPDHVKAFFDNGGSTLYFVRVLGSSSGANTKATLQLNTVGGPSAGSLTGTAGPWALTAGMTFLGKVDAAAPITATVAATNASKTGAAASYAIGAGGDTVVIAITGVPGNQTIDLSTAAATEAGYLAAINSQLIGGSAVDAAGQLKIQTDAKGSAAGGSIVSFGGAGAAKTGLAAGAFTNAGPNNVANVAAVTPTELAAIFNGVLVGSTSVGNNTTGSIVWASNTTGGASSVQFSSGTGVASITGFDTAVHSGAASAAIPVATVTSVGEGSDNNSYSNAVSSQNASFGLALGALVVTGAITTVQLTSTAIGRVQPGDTLLFVDPTTVVTCRGIVKQVTNNSIILASAMTVGAGGLTVANTTVTLETWSHSVLYNGTVVQGPISGLRLSPLSQRNYFVTQLGGVANNSYGRNALNDEYLVTVADLSATGSNLDLRPVNVNTSGTGDLMTGGAEMSVFADADYTGNPAASPPTGLYAFDRVLDLRMLAIPGITGTVAGFVSKSLFQYCENRKDVWAVLPVPLNTTPANTVTYFNSNIGSTSYASLYYCNLVYVSPLTNQRAYITPEGFVMGMVARTDRDQGISKAPAGEFAGRLVGVVDVERILSSDDKDLLYPLNINPIENIAGVGVCVMGSRTLENGDFNQIHVRRTMIYLEQSLKIGTRFVIFEPNTPLTRAKLKRATDTFLEREWRTGTLSGDTLSQAFTTICDKSNNPDAVVLVNQMYEDIFVNIPMTVENLVISIQQDQRGKAALAAA